MKTLFVMTASLLVLGQTMALESTALAQDSQRNLPPKSLRAQPQSGTAGNVPEAPVGHRQPTPGSLPPETGKNDPSQIDAQDKQLDRMIKNICKGC